MNRRHFIGTPAGGLLAAPLAAEAQQAGKVPRIGFLGLASASSFGEQVEALRAGLRDLGYLEGKNVVIDYRWAENKSIGSRIWQANCFGSGSTSS